MGCISSKTSFSWIRQKKDQIERDANHGVSKGLKPDEIHMLATRDFEKNPMSMVYVGLDGEWFGKKTIKSFKVRDNGMIKINGHASSSSPEIFTISEKGILVFDTGTRRIVPPAPINSKTPFYLSWIRQKKDQIDQDQVFALQSRRQIAEEQNTIIRELTTRDFAKNPMSMVYVGPNGEWTRPIPFTRFELKNYGMIMIDGVFSLSNNKVFTISNCRAILIIN